MLRKVLKGIVLAIDAASALVVTGLAAALLPGDKVNANVVGSVALMAFVVIVATAVSIPTQVVLRRTGDSLFEGIKLW